MGWPQGLERLENDKDRSSFSIHKRDHTEPAQPFTYLLGQLIRGWMSFYMLHFASYFTSTQYIFANSTHKTGWEKN
jgi:hypothetical protein